jgi:hypothetical protein
MADKQQYNQNNTTITLKRYQNNTRKNTLILRAMFTGLFEGETSSRVELYYNNIQARVIIPSTPIYTKYVYQKNHLEEDPSRSRSFY